MDARGQKIIFMKKQPLIIYSDGGARGNPGPAAAGYVVGGKSFGEYIGETTNNVAEYKALIFGLKKGISLLGKEKAAETDVQCNLDSELLVRQLNGQYKVKNANLKPLFLEALSAKRSYKSVSFTHIPREINKEADRMVNLTLDNLH